MIVFCLFQILLFTTCDIEHVFIAKGNVRCSALQNAANVNAEHLQCAVWLHAVHHSMLRDGSLGQSGCSLNQRFDGADVATNLIHAWTEHGAFDLHHVLIAVQRRVNADGVFVHQFELAHVEFAHTEYGVPIACLTVNADGFGIGIAGESASIAE